jgi:hypothetical protein
MARVHYATVVGVPCCGLGALFIVLLLRNIAGAIQFKAFSLEFKGASGPIIMCDDEDVESDRRGYYPSEYLSKIITVLDSAIHQ